MTEAVQRSNPSGIDTARLAEIEWLKGIAILWVIWIHSGAFDETWVFEQFINRAVPIFLVLFGVTSELWWRRAQRVDPQRVVHDWYAKRLRRLLPGYFAVMSLWWLTALLLADTHPIAGLSWKHAVVTALGYSPWAMTTWFFSVITVMTILFPVVRRACDGLGTAVCAIMAFAICGVSCWYIFSIMDAGVRLFGPVIHGTSPYYYWVFFPRYFWHVIAGILVARVWNARLSRTTTALAVVVSAVGMIAMRAVWAGPGDIYGGLQKHVISQLLDVPVALALLGLLSWFPPPAIITRVLALCGRWSWGLYLGHICVYELSLLPGYGFAGGPLPQRLAFYVAMLALGSGLAVAGNELRKRLAVVRS
ncbi:MAG TPA: acyltransferase [Polyangiaceae bacterium]